MYKKKMQYVPAWSITYSPEQTKKQLGNFRFAGAGWYFTKTDTILVSYIDGEVFRFDVWNYPNANKAFNEVIGAPTIADSR